MVMYMGWKDDFKKSFDQVYESVRRNYTDIQFPCYGGRYHWFLFTRYFENLYFYLTENSLIYTASSAYITEIKFHDVKKISIRQGWLFKSSFHIRIVADKKYHLQINEIKDFSTKLTGNSADNVKNFIDMLRTNIRK